MAQARMDFLHVNMSPSDTNSPAADTRSIASNSSHATNISSAIDTTISSLLEGYSSLSVARLLQPLAASFHHRVLPESLGWPVRDRNSFANHAAGIFSVFSSFQLNPVFAVRSDSSPPTVVMRAKMAGVLCETKQPWDNECLMIIRLSQDGSEVVEIDEFVDSAKAKDMESRHAPDDFGATTKTVKREKKEAEHLVYAGSPTIVSFLCLLFCLIFRNWLGTGIALFILWLHPVLEILRVNMIEEWTTNYANWVREYM